MLLFILGTILFIAGLFIGRRPSPLSSSARYMRLGGLVILLLGFFSACFVQIGTGEVGVQVLFGSVQNSTLSSGLHLVNPLVEVQRLDIKTQNYTMSAVHNEGAK